MREPNAFDAGRRLARGVCQRGCETDRQNRATAHKVLFHVEIPSSVFQAAIFTQPHLSEASFSAVRHHILEFFLI
jgi:hypothetical protein